MSALKKVTAVVLGTGSAAGYLATAAVEVSLRGAAMKIGDGNVKNSEGKTYTRKDFESAAETCKRGEEFFAKGVSKAVELWKDKDDKAQQEELTD